MVLLYDKGLSDKKQRWQSMAPLQSSCISGQLDSVPKVSLNFEEDDDSRCEGGEEEVMEGGRNETADEVDEFDESSDEEVEIEDEQEIVTGNQDEIGRATDFLLGARSRFGRAIRFNNRIVGKGMKPVK